MLLSSFYCWLNNLISLVGKGLLKGKTLKKFIKNIIIIINNDFNKI
jgi:hypothetical protein